MKANLSSLTLNAVVLFFLLSNLSEFQILIQLHRCHLLNLDEISPRELIHDVLIAYEKLVFDRLDGFDQLSVFDQIVIGIKKSTLPSTL